MKYVLMGTSTSFGNMFSAAGAVQVTRPSRRDAGPFAEVTQHVDDDQAAEATYGPLLQARPAPSGGHDADFDRGDGRYAFETTSSSGDAVGPRLEPLAGRREPRVFDMRGGDETFIVAGRSREALETLGRRFGFDWTRRSASPAAVPASDRRAHGGDLVAGGIAVRVAGERRAGQGAAAVHLPDPVWFGGR
ncbi:hypothetical protein [Actinomadura nitritigenes]|uniref:hypothetical protein n=1 Tax=Actinomadura nitritigenes TaxID=134602 RepID=UPI003D928DFC